MRLLLITDNHTPTGGAEKVFFELKERLTQIPGMTVFSLGFTPKPTQTANSLTFAKTRNPWRKLWWQIFTHPSTYQQLKKAIDDFKPDIIHLHNFKEHTAALLKAIRGHTILHTLHDFSVICPGSYNVHRDLTPCSTGFRLRCALNHRHKYRLPVYAGLVFSYFLQRRRLQKCVSQFTGVSPVLAEFVRHSFKQPVTFLPPFTLPPQNVNPSPTPAHFLYIGQLSHHKGVHHLLHEFAIAFKKHPELRLTLVGDGPDKEKLQQLCKQLTISDAVDFTGWKTEPHIYYLSHRAVILPSLCMEAFGLTLAEGMAHGKPLIVSDRGAPTWLVENQVTGYHFNPKIRGDLAQKIIELAADPEKAQKMGEAGYQKYKKNFNNEKILADTIALYQKTPK